MPPVINLEKSKAAMDKQKELNSREKPPAGKWSMVATTLEVRAVGKSTIHGLGIQLLLPVSGIRKEDLRRAEAIAGRARIYVDVWVPSEDDGDDSPTALRYGNLLVAVGAKKVPDLKNAADVAGVLTGVPFLGTFEHVASGKYTNTRFLEVLPLEAKSHAALMDKTFSGKLAEKTADRVITRQARAAGASGEDPHGESPPVESYTELV